MPQRRKPCAEGAVQHAKQQVVNLLQQTRDYVHHLQQRIEGPMAPRPALACTEQRKRKRARSPAPRAADQCLSAHLAIPRTPTQDLLPCLQGELRNHQLAGVKWLANLYSNGINGIISDELQQDRQVQVVGLYAYLKNKGVGGPFLIVASAGSLQSWATELHRLLPQGLLVHVYNSTNSHDMMGLLCSGQGDPANPLTRVVLMSHEAFSADRHLLRGYPFKHVTFDASGHSGTAMQDVDLCYDMQGLPCILLLTGSHPAQGRGQALQELWPLVRLVLPDAWEQIRAAVNGLTMQMPAALAAEVSVEVLEMLQEIVDRFVLSRTADEVDLAQPRRDTKVNLYDFFMDTNE